MSAIVTFEMLPDEMILQVCQYLRSADILYSFFNLNTRLNATIAGFCHYLNLNNVTHKQFDCLLSGILSPVGPSIRTLVVNGNWLSFSLNKLHPIHFDWNLSLMFPNLHTLILEYFTGEQLFTFLDKIKDLLQLVKLDIKCLMGRRSDELLKKVLAANNGRLRSVTFDYNSTFLTVTTINKTVSYPNIKELTVYVIECDMLGDLFTLIPNVRRLHISFGISPIVSTATLKNVPPLLHLNDFQLHSIDMVWTLEDIVDILCKMPLLRRLALYLSAEDRCLVSGQNLTEVLPSSLVQMDFFMFYYFSRSCIEVDTLLDAWPPGHISISYLLNEPRPYAIIHTVPFNLVSIVIPATIGKYMLPIWKYMQNVEDLSIYGEASSLDILMTVQHFHRLRTLKIDLRTGTEAPTRTESAQRIFAHLPRLKQVKVAGSCEVFHLLEAAPNLDDLSIDFDCYNRIIDDGSTSQLLQKRIVRLEIVRLRNVPTIQLDVIIRQFPNLRYMILSVKDSKVLIDPLILQALEMWRKEELIYLCINGSLSKDANNNLRQWFIDHSHLEIKNSFAIDNLHKWIHLWF